MITDKISKLGVALAMLGLGLLDACSDNNVASSYSDKSSAVASRDRLRSQFPDAWLLYYGR